MSHQEDSDFIIGLIIMCHRGVTSIGWVQSTTVGRETLPLVKHFTIGMSTVPMFAEEIYHILINY